ncbi:MAG: hypothetical protein ACMXYC_00370 [Candidatus Woesearchaeota archaeon]
MLEIAYTPHWFYGNEIIIDIVSVVVLLLIALFSLKSYYVTKTNKNHLIFSTAFFLLAFSFIGKILMNFTVFYKQTVVDYTTPLILSYTVIQSTETLVIWGYFFYRIFTLIGFYLLFRIYHKHSLCLTLLIMYLLIATTFLSYPQGLLFHLNMFLLLSLIAIHHRKHCLNFTCIKQNCFTFSFALLAISQLLMIFMAVPSVYVIGRIVQFSGYVALLVTFLLVLFHGKKKVKK